MRKSFFDFNRDGKLGIFERAARSATILSIIEKDRHEKEQIRQELSQRKHRLYPSGLYAGFFETILESYGLDYVELKYFTDEYERNRILAKYPKLNTPKFKEYFEYDI